MKKAKERLLQLMLEAELRRGQDARRIDSGKRGKEALPLSYAQERLWFLGQLALAGAAYNLSLALRLTGLLLPGLLEQAFTDLVRRHEPLRTRFASLDGVPHQVIDLPRKVELNIKGLSSIVDADERERQVREYLAHEQLHQFDLNKDWPLRLLLLELGPQEHVLVITIHHIATDGWSLGVLVRELSALYTAHRSNLAPLLPELSVQYADYAIWQRRWLQGAVLDERLNYWRQRLLDAPPQLSLPTDRPRPAIESFRGAMLTFELPVALAAALKGLARGEGATLFMVALAAYQILLSRWSGQQDIIVGSPIAGRHHPQVEGLIGFFVNTLVARTDLSGEPTFRQLLNRVRAGTLADMAYQDLPFDLLVKELRPDRNLTRQPIFQVTLVVQNYPQEHLELPDLSWSWTGTDCVTSQFDLSLYLYDGGSELTAVWQYATDLFDEATIRRMAGAFEVLLEGIVANPDCSVTRLPMLRAPQREQLLVDWNRTGATFAQDHRRPRGLCVHELFSEQARRTPQAPALVHEAGSLNYAELERRSNQLANILQARGVGPDVVVGLCVERSPELMIGLFGILKAGGAYLPLDPDYPRQRLELMLADARASLVLTQSHLLETLPEHAASLIVLDGVDLVGDAEAPACVADPENLAYLIYTSGSTGTPKGVAMSHRALCNQMMWMKAQFGIDAHDTLLHKTPISFDASVWELFLPLLCGARLALARPEGQKDPAYLCAAIRKWQVTLLQLVPSVLQLVFAAPDFAACTTLRSLFSGGEPLTADLRDRILGKLPVSIHNLYGPTETCIQAVVHSCQKQLCRHVGGVPIGRPVANTEVYVLDRDLEPVPVGVPGELYIGGVQLARGYFGQPSLTAERFIADRFSEKGGRLYRTGDRVRYLADGNLEFVGRADAQVKIRGYRIEPAEIESLLTEHPAIKQAIVVAREDSAGNRRLVAYLVEDLRVAITAGSERAQLVPQLREFARQRLPDYMVPAAWMVLDSLPILPNGKVDRRALPAPQDRSDVTDEYVAPRTAVERALAECWRTLLQVDRVGVRDNFFELGGHSLHVMKLVAAIGARFGVTLPVIAVFQAPRVADLASIIESLQGTQDHLAVRTEGPVVFEGKRHALIPLSLSQLAHWRAYRLHERSAIRQIAAAIRLRGALNLNLLEQSLAAVLSRHEVLRTLIVIDEEMPAQRLCDPWVQELRPVDLSAGDVATRAAQIERHIVDLIMQPLDLGVGPLFAARMLKLRDDDHVLIIAMEHLVSDGFSLNIILHDVRNSYTQLALGRRAELPRVSLQFRDYALWQNRKLDQWLAGGGQSWCERMLSVPRLRFPRDLACEALHRTPGWETFPVRIDKDLTGRLRSWCRERGTTLVMAVSSAYFGLLLRWCQSSHAVFQYQSDGRVWPQVEKTVGYFASVLFLAVSLDENTTFLDLLDQVTAAYSQALELADFSSYLATREPRPAVTRNPGLNWLPRRTEDETTASRSAATLPLSWETISFSHPMSKHLIMDLEPTLLMWETKDELVGEWYYPRERFAAETLATLARSLVAFVETLVQAPSKRIATL